MRRRPLRTAVALALTAMAEAALAQATAPAPAAAASAPAASTADAGAIVVTGQKIQRSTQDTYTSTGVVTSEQIEDLKLRDVRDALKLQGNVYVAPSNNGNNGISIRGLNSEGIGEPGANMRPLMTLSIDGAAQSFEGVRRGQRGSWDVEQIEVARGPQSTLQGRNSLAGSLTVKTFDPTPHWEAAGRLTVGEGDQVAPAMMLSGPLAGESLMFRLAAEQQRGNNGIHHLNPDTAFLSKDHYDNLRGKLLWKPPSLPGFEAKLTLSATTDQPAVGAVSQPWRDRQFDAETTAAEGRRNKVRNHVLELSQRLQPGLTLVSITAHVETDALLTGRGSINDLPYRRDETRVDSDTTQELRLVYDRPGSGITAVGGLFAGHFGNHRDSLVTLGSEGFQDLESRRRDRSLALFGEVTWQFAPLWKLTAGARYDDERSRLAVDDQLVGEIERSRFQHHAFLPKLGLAYALTPTQSVALTASTGYRAGFREEGRDVAPEYLRSYELAYRSAWQGGRVLFNANLFHYDWRDQQISVPVGSAGLTYTDNVGRSHVDGAEVSLTWRQGRWLDVGASLGLTRAVLDEALMTVVDADFSGKEFPEAPRVSGGLWGTVRFHGGWFLSADVTARSRAWATGDLYNRSDLRVPGRAVLGLRGGYEVGALSVVLWVDNATNRQYISGRDTRGGVYVGDARRAGVTLSARY